jgi:hypothetical protein
MSEVAHEADISRHDKIGANNPKRKWRTRLGTAIARSGAPRVNIARIGGVRQA